MQQERQLFLNHIAPTSLESMAFPIRRAEGTILFDEHNNKFIDLIGGISVANVGHGHPAIVKAVQDQAAAYMHVMVYGEAVLSPMVQYGAQLASLLPKSLDCVYFVNSGAEAVDGAMKLAKRYTNRSEIISCYNSYHGSTQGAMSLMSDHTFTNAFRPLLPQIRHIYHNNFEELEKISSATAAIVVEVVQAEGGVLAADPTWLTALRQKCTETGTLLIFDEIQTGFGRTGKLWAFEHYNVVPDILLLGKALGGGMPMGAFIASKEMMKTLAHDPILGHMTTFGGHPVCCAAGKAALDIILSEKIIDNVETKGQLFESLLQHPKIKRINRKGLMMSVSLGSFENVKKFIELATLNPSHKPQEEEIAGIFTDWFLFNAHSFRIVPPLNINDEHIQKACDIIKYHLDRI